MSWYKRRTNQGCLSCKTYPDVLCGGTEQPQELAWVLIGSAQVESQLPTEDELKSYNPFKDDDLRKEANPRRLQLTFDIGVNSFFVCGKPYDHKAPPLELPLDKVDDG